MCLAIPGCIEQIEAIDGNDPEQAALSRWGRVRFGQVAKRVNLSLVPEADVGDFVLVHVGIAIVRIDLEEAERVYDLLDAMAPAGSPAPPDAGAPDVGSSEEGTP